MCSHLFRLFYIAFVTVQRAMVSVQDRDLDLNEFTELTVQHPRILSLFRIASLDELCVKRLAIEQMTIAQFNPK